MRVLNVTRKWNGIATTTKDRVILNVLGSSLHYLTELQQGHLHEFLLGGRDNFQWVKNNASGKLFANLDKVTRLQRNRRTMFDFCRLYMNKKGHVIMSSLTYLSPLLLRDCQSIEAIGEHDMMIDDVMGLISQFIVGVPNNVDDSEQKEDEM